MSVAFRVAVILSVAMACGSCGDKDSHKNTFTDNSDEHLNFVTFPPGGEALISSGFGVELRKSTNLSMILSILNDKKSYIYPPDQTPNHLICSRNLEKGEIKKIISASVKNIYGPQSQKVSFGFDAKENLVCADILKPKEHP
jgi:hypothetical protein